MSVIDRQFVVSSTVIAVTPLAPVTKLNFYAGSDRLRCNSNLLGWCGHVNALMLATKRGHTSSDAKFCKGGGSTAPQSERGQGVRPRTISLILRAFWCISRLSTSVSNKLISELGFQFYPDLLGHCMLAMQTRQ